MSNKVCILDQGPACEPDKLIVEIVGKEHPDSQKLLICDAQGQPLEAVTAAAVEESISGEGVSSLLKVWDWDEQPGETLYLEIASESGEPIRLPLLSDLRVTARQDEAQLNQIVPVVPCTALPGIRRPNDLGIPVLVRSGYIYVFYRQKLWRELEVRFTDTGTYFHDIDVESYRRGERGFASGKREATGVALEDIWLPAQWNGRRAGPVQLMFSEVQLNSARLAYLESHEMRLSSRTRSPNLLVSEPVWQRRWADSPDGKTMLETFVGSGSGIASNAGTTRYRMELFTFPVNLCPPQRQRQPAHEWLLDQPALMLCDLSGGYPEQAMASTRQTADVWRAGESVDPPAEFEPEAWRGFYVRSDAGSIDDDAEKLWQAQEAQSDVLQSVRDRQLYAVLLPDSMHRMRHLHARIDCLQELLKICVRLAIEHPHHASALLLHNLAVPPSIGGGRNPLHQSLQSKLGERGKREINVASAAAERAYVWQQLDNAQQILTDGLKSEQYQQCLADHLSLDQFDYQAAMFSAVRLMASIVTSPAQLDPLAINGDIHNAVTGARLHRTGRSPGQQLMREVANRATHPLHVMLWPELKEEELFAAYQRPAQEEPNAGDGRFRATALASLEEQDSPDENTETLDGITLASLMSSGTLQDSFTAHKIFKAGMSVLSKINEILSGAVLAAENGIANLANQTIDNNRTMAGHQADIDRARQDQSRQRSELGARGRAMSIQLHGMNAEHLRQTMPRAFDNALFVRIGNLGNKKITDYYLLGLEDLPEVNIQEAEGKMFGRYLDRDGKPLAMTNGTAARRAGMQIAPEAGTYFVIPRNSETAGILSQLNQAIHQESLASSALLASRASAEQLGADLQRATDNLRRAREGLAARVLNSKPFSAVVLMMEIWNVRVAIEEAEKIGLERGEGRLKVGMFAAYADLMIALEALTSKLVSNQSILSAAGRPFVTLSEQRLGRIVGMRLATHLAKEISVRLLGQVTAGLVFAGLSVSDAIHAARWSDNAVWGHGMMAAGGLLAAGGALLAGSSLLGPVGLAALVLIIGGAAVVALFSNTPFEDWLAGSAFAGESSGTGSQHYLRDPDQSFYRLVGLFAGIRIQIDENPEYDPAALNDGSDSPDALKLRANTCISVRSNIKGMAAQLGSQSLIFRCQLMRNEVRYGHGSLGLSSRATLRPLPSMSHPLFQHDVDDTLVVYVNTPANTRQSHPFQDYDEYHWEVRAQFRLKDPRHDKSWVFPAPEPKVKPVDPARYEEPCFTRTNQLLWADQESHAATGVAG
ncbi:hypothetical protein [Pseudomonas jilinensis]|uniref:Uncharacterized protein n=1 Tax=Pseudomonas jilinensis TaxID=2078689 RepID=A0A396RT60_9PSED|nr:hypothetical protein [Pseudomonas jilinensis]RHW19529.1 hypothetical protein C2846_18340 [Pseudomonas jilinensis]